MEGFPPDNADIFTGRANFHSILMNFLICIAGTWILGNSSASAMESQPLWPSGATWMENRPPPHLRANDAILERNRSSLINMYGMLCKASQGIYKGDCMDMCDM